MREVAVLGVGMHPWGKFDKSLTEISREAVLAALKDAGIEWREIQAVSAASSHFSGGKGWGLNGNDIVEDLGSTGVPIYNLSAGCAAGGYAFNVGYTLVASGMYDMVLVMGGEKLPGGFIQTSLIEDPTDMEYLRQVCIGMPGPAFWAMMTRRRMADFGTTEAILARIAVKAHKNSMHNPYARFRQEWTIEDVLNSPIVTEPLRLYEICPISDGAAAAILCSAEIARKKTSNPTWVAACSVATTEFAWATGGGLGGPTPPGRPIHSEVALAVNKAFKQASLGPKDIDFIELQDNIVTYELVNPEDWGFCEPGEADRLVEQGQTGPTGRLPINPSGGFLSFGEATTAMGVFQVCQAVDQLRGQAGARQVPDAKVGMCQTLGLGGNGTAVILKR